MTRRTKELVAEADLLRRAELRLRAGCILTPEEIAAVQADRFRQSYQHLIKSNQAQPGSTE